MLTIGFLWLAGRAGRRAARGCGSAAVRTRPAPRRSVRASRSRSSRDLRESRGPHLPSLGSTSMSRCGAWRLGGVCGGRHGDGAMWNGRCAARPGPLRGVSLSTAGHWLRAVGVFVVATFEPSLTRRTSRIDRVESSRVVRSSGCTTRVPGAERLLFAPVGVCLEVIGDGPILHLCRGTSRNRDHGAGFLPEPLALTPSLWL